MIRDTAWPFRVIRNGSSIDSARTDGMYFIQSALIELDRERES
jgi:hypothetical protein